MDPFLICPRGDTLPVWYAPFSRVGFNLALLRSVPLGRLIAKYCGLYLSAEQIGCHWYQILFAPCNVLRYSFSLKHSPNFNMYLMSVFSKPLLFYHYHHYYCFCHKFSQLSSPHIMEISS